MSLFGSLMGDFDDDIFGNHMNAMNMQMRSMNRLMNSFMPDPFNMLTSFDPGFQNNALMERGPGPMNGFMFPPMPNINRLLNADIGGGPGSSSYCSSSVISMSSGPDGRPQIYQQSSSTKTGPNGVRETRRTVQDSTKGIKKMAIGHHIGDRSHIIEKEQDLQSGQMEERQEFINLDEEEAEDFDREFTNKARGSAARSQGMLSIEPADDEDVLPRHHRQHRRLPALPPAPSLQNNSSSSPSSSSPLTSKNKSSSRANASNSTTISNDIADSNNYALHLNNNYLSGTPRRTTATTYRNHLTGATARRPLRSPTSSPLTTTPPHYGVTCTASPSVHPHPYNATAARRNHRPKHTKHQQPHVVAPPSPPVATVTIIEDVSDLDEKPEANKDSKLV